MAEPGKKFPWEEKLVRSGFFVGAVLLHLVIFTLVASYVIFSAPQPEPQASFVSHFTQQPPVTPPVTPTDATALSANTVSINPTDAADPKITPQNVIQGASDIKVSVPAGPGNLGDIHGLLDNHPTPKIHLGGLPAGRIELIKKFEEAHRPPGSIRNHDPAGDYPVYVASYADGDWDCNTELDADGNIVAGSIPNLVAKITEWTHSQVNAHVVAKPLKIGGPELLKEQPPFIFLTGHKDFVLTPQEVENLRDYVEMGGFIWGDNAEAGGGSRFDVAFHREMKRVIPSEAFQPFASDADIFKSRFQFDQTPQGMNYLAEPIEHMDLDGQLAILYTPNDYSDLYTMRILPGDEQIQGTLPAPDSPLTTPGLFLGNRSIYFRNFTLPSSLAVQHLGLNIVTYLITRFDDELQLAP